MEFIKLSKTEDWIYRICKLKTIRPTVKDIEGYYYLRKDLLDQMTDKSQTAELDIDTWKNLPVIDYNDIKIPKNEDPF